MSKIQGQRVCGPNLGTYSFDEFDEKKQELARLKEQATSFWEQERQYWLRMVFRSVATFLILPVAQEWSLAKSSHLCLTVM